MRRYLLVFFCFFSFQMVWGKSPGFFVTNRFLKDTVNQKKPPVNADTVIVPVIKTPAHLNSESIIFKRRLDSLKKDVPLDYNEYVQSYIDNYSHNRDEMAHVLGLTKYYFPIYEKAFRDAGIPEEIKYLSIVESKLDPFAVSRSGATGPWQFMFTTARLYGLNIDGYIDERRDPVRASYAAAAYLKDAYQKFGDWLVAIASYNCGSSNVERAIAKAGGASDFWSIRPFLPLETRGYVPAFIAVTYLMNYYKKHDIIPSPCSFSFKTDTVMVDKFVSLKAIAKVLAIDINQLSILNPAYKRQILNGTNSSPRRLVLPQIEKEKYSGLYDALNNNNIVSSIEQTIYTSYHRKNGSANNNMPSYHIVKKGETLGEIADNFGVEVQDLKVWNHLHSNKAATGQKLKLTGPDAVTYNKPLTNHHHSYITYTVKSGDTLSGIAAKFEGASIEKIRALNRIKKDRIHPGMTIKI